MTVACLQLVTVYGSLNINSSHRQTYLMLKVIAVHLDQVIGRFKFEDCAPSSLSIRNDQVGKDQRLFCTMVWLLRCGSSCAAQLPSLEMPSCKSQFSGVCQRCLGWVLTCLRKVASLSDSKYTSYLSLVFMETTKFHLEI